MSYTALFEMAVISVMLAGYTIIASGITKDKR